MLMDAGDPDAQRNLSRLKSYMPDVFMWVRSYREGTFMLPMTEDYIFQIAAGTQQVFDLVIDVERAGVRPRARGRVKLYGVMGLASLRLEVSFCCDFLHSVPLLSAISGLDS